MAREEWRHGGNGNTAPERSVEQKRADNNQRTSQNNTCAARWNDGAMRSEPEARARELQQQEGRLKEYVWLRVGSMVSRRVLPSR